MDTIENVQFRDLAVEEFNTTTALVHARQQAEQRHYEDFPIIDVDGHHLEVNLTSQIVEYIEDPVMRDQAKYLGLWRQRHRRADGLLSGPDRPHHPPRDGRQPEKFPPGTHRDITYTKRWMDALRHRPGADVPDADARPAVHAAPPKSRPRCARAYNAWLCERILAQEPRICASLYLPANDPEAMYKVG